MRYLLLLLLVALPVLAQPVSDPGKTLTIVPPKGWASAAQEKNMTVSSPDNTASIALVPRASIPLDDAAAMKAIVGSLTGDGWKLGRQGPANVGGIKAVRLEVEGVSGDNAEDRGIFYMVSDARRGWIIFCLSSKAASSKNLPQMEASVRSISIAK